MGSVVLFASLLLMIIMGIPIAIALGLSSCITIICFDTATPLLNVRSIVTAVQSYPLLAIPLFILAGELMATGGLSKRLVALVDAWMCRIEASLAYATVVASTFFAAISGSGPATVAAIGSNIVPEMEKRGYPKSYGTALSAASGIVGVLIPPSIPFVMYGISSEESISTLFMAGIIPGLLFSVAFCIVAKRIYKKRDIQVEKVEFDLTNAWKATIDGIWAIICPIIVLGSIYGGICSPTEAAAVSVVYAIVIGMFVYRELKWADLVNAFASAAKTTATCMGLVAFAATFSRLLTLDQVTVKVASFIMGLTTSRILVLILVNVLLILVGMFMETVSSIIILTPILLPVVEAYGVKPVHFGIIMTANLAIGFCTPPLGVNLFVASGISGLSVEKIVKEILPYLATMIVVLLLITFIPDLSLLLPRILAAKG